MFTKKNLGWLVAGGLFLLLGIVFSVVKPETLVGAISIDLEKRTFSGSVTGLMLAMGAVFLWFGFRETKEDVLQTAKKRLEDATNRLMGRVINLRFRLGPNPLVLELKSLLKNGKLQGVYIVKEKGVELKRSDNILRLFEDPAGGAIMAEVGELPAEEDTLIEVVVNEKQGARQWRALESVRVRTINLEQER